ncbi:MAG: alpha/beta fold hydrolase [Candidatus Krumholzibacteriia bacterium]
MSEATGFAEFDGWRVAYEVRGHGDGSIVFVHGGASNRSVWRAQMEGVDLGRRLVAVDLIGHGQSDKPHAAYTMGLLARSVAAVMDDLGIERAVLVGHSNGVPVVRQFSRLYPDRIEALVTVDGPLRRALSKEKAEWMRAVLDSPDYEQFMKMLVEQTPMAGLSAEDLARVQEATLSTPKHVMAGGLDALMDPAIWTEDEIGVPVLVLLSRGPSSQLWTDDYEGFVRRIAPRVEYYVWTDVSHFLTLEQPERFNALIEAFVARVDAGDF